MENDWHDFYEFSKTIKDSRFDNVSNDCLYRNAISRCYYASFHHVKSILYNNTGFKEHKDVALYLETRIKPEFKKIYDNYYYLYKKRKASDYEDEYPGTIERDIPNVIKYTENVLILSKDMLK